MPLPYSADLRERVLLAYEHSEGTAAALARRFRVALNTVKNWVRAAESEGRRVAKPLGHGPDRVWARPSVRCCANWWRLTIMPPWPNMARGWRGRPGSGSAGRCSVSPSSAWAWHVKKDAPGERAGTRRCRRRTRRLCRTGQEHRARDPGLSRRDRDQYQADAALCARPAGAARLRHRTRSLAPPHRARRAGAERPGLRHDRARCHRLAGVSGVSATRPDPLLAPAQARRHRGHGPPRCPSPAPGARAVGPSTGSGVPVSRCCPCRATPPTCRRSNPAGPSSRRPCAPLSRARLRPSRNRSSRPSTPSLPKMPRAGSAIAGMLCQANPKTALVLQLGFILRFLYCKDRKLLVEDPGVPSEVDGTRWISEVEKLWLR